MRKLIGGAVVAVLIAFGACNPLPTEYIQNCRSWTETPDANMAEGDTISDWLHCEEQDTIPS